jgi:hypothetical protein
MKHALALFCVALAPCALAAQPGSSTDLGYGLTLGATRSDNAGRTAADAESETSFEAGFNANLQHQHNRLAARLAADLAYRTHDYGGYEDELLGGLAAEASWRFAPWLSWVATENFGQSLIDSRSTERPDNTQNTNYFSTGPDIQLPLGARTSLVLQGRWSDVSYEESDVGTRRLSGTAGLRRNFSQRTGVSLNFSTDHVDYKSLPTSSNYDIHSAYLGWDATGARTTLNLRAGVTRLEDAVDSTESTLFGLDLNRELTARSSLGLSVGRSFGSSADLLRRDQGIGGIGTGAGDRPAITAADPQRIDHARLSWALRGERMSVTTGARWEREAHRQERELNRRLLGGSLQASRRLGPRATLNLSTDYFREEFGIAAIESDEWSVGLGVHWTATRTVGLAADWTHMVGDGDTSAGAGTRDFTENRYTLRLTWSPVR